MQTARGGVDVKKKAYRKPEARPTTFGVVLGTRA
jgi:hypothetical protein